MGIETLDLTVERHWCLFFMGTLLLKNYWSIAYFRILLPSFLFKNLKVVLVNIQVPGTLWRRFLYSLIRTELKKK
jgi:hypothetical protein